MSIYNFHAHLKSNEHPQQNTHYCSGHPEDWEQLLAWQQKGSSCSLGIHPWALREAPPDWYQNLELHLLAQPQLHIGECGLDYARFKHQKEKQIHFFLKHLELAQKHNRSLSVHCVRAWGDLQKCLHNFPNLKSKVLIHGFSGSKEIAHELLSWGAYLSLGPNCLEWSEEKWGKKIPAGVLLLPESDDMDPADYEKIADALFLKFSQQSNLAPRQLDSKLQEAWENLFPFQNRH